MDHFGIGAGVKGSIEVYFSSSRHTGRTVSLVESLKDGDRVVFLNSQEARRVERLCKERGVTITTVIVDIDCPHRIREHGTSEGRTIFDHSWVEMFYRRTVEQASAALDMFERDSPGYGEAHRETRRRAEELAKWRF